ncbi:hypothetical protein NSA47_02330 [Irregularibacter muris]|uniref:Uncharacterized protein n=1 Tax=Irregularibacter muris TaxID=1796619 RepID=A0AAE3KYN5_9FIRM|nr:hypothetical protein [Irregularibacter muris]MCR1897825.1 hypothetical protein [Irregularibacter muris]
MALIDTFKDRFGRFVYPKTVPKAIIDPDTGESLDKFFDREFYEKIGDPSFLETIDKSTLVSAINELKTKDDLHLAETMQQSGGVHGLEIERGSWSAELSTTNGDGVADYGSYERFGTYVRIGDLVYITFRMNVESFTNCTGYYIITGLPFYSSGSDRYRYIVAPSNLDGATDYASIRGTDIRVRSSPQAIAQAVPFTSTKYIHGSGVYHIG